MGKWFQNKSFSTEKQEQGIKARKGHRGINARKIHRDIKARKMHRAFGVLLAAALVFQTVPFEGIAVSASESSGGGLCEHHRSHTPDCGYKEAEPGHGCTHEHTEDCYRTVEGEDGSTTKELDCHHEHDESCGYREAAEGSPCTFVCEICRGGTDEIPEDKTDDNEINDGGSENQGTENGDETEEPDDGQEECTCEELCTEDNGNGGCRINTDCPVCGAEDASLSDCKGKDTEDSTEDAEESTDQPEDTGLCRHHQEHDDACGYLPESEDSEGRPCTYECHICSIEALIAALPDKVTEDNAEDVRVQLDKILALFAELTEDEQEQIDLSRVYELQGVLDNANAPIPLVNGDVTLIDDNKEAIFTVGECGDNCQGHTITQNVQSGVVQSVIILVESGTHNITFSGLNLSSATVGIMPGGTMNLTLVGTNKIVGSGCGFYVPVGATLVITEQSTGSLDISLNSSATAAGIGGAYYDPNRNVGDFNCGMVVINGGTITAAGRDCSAGIGGASYAPNFGNGGNVTITGGHVTATGSDGAPGIGGGKDADSDGSLTLNSADVLDNSTTLGSKGTYAINGDPTADMIVVPKLVYTGEVLDTSGIKIDDSKTGTATYFGQTFRVQASADGWVLQDLGEVKEGGEYTAVFKKGDKTISKTFTVKQSGTDLTSEGKVLTYNGDTQTTTFIADDTITVKATPTATGQAPANSAMFAASFTGPGAGQMAVFVGDTQVSAPAVKGADDSYTMTVSAADVLTNGQAGQDNKYTLIVRFVENTNMDNAEAPVEVTVTPNPLTEGMITLSEESATYDGYEHKPIVTIDGLDEGTDYEITYSSQDFTNAGTVAITVTGKGIYAGTVEKSFTIEKGTLTVSGTCIATGTYGAKLSALTIEGNWIVKSESGAGVPGRWTLTGDAIPNVGDSGEYTATFVPVSGAENYYPLTVRVKLDIQPAEQATPAAPTATEENIKDTSITLTTVENAEYSLDGMNWQDSPVFAGLEANKEYTFHIRLKADKNHNASPDSTASITTRKTTLNGASVTVSGSYTYTGAAVVPVAGDVAVILNGTTIDSGQYTISIANNVNAGTATVTITATAAGDYSGSASTTFFIEKAALTIKANSQSIICGGSIAQGTGQATATGLCTGDILSGITLTASTGEVPGGDITPSAAQIKNGSNEDVTANYDIVYEAGKLTISYMDSPAAILYNGEAVKGWYNGDVVITAEGYTVSDTLGRDYKDSYIISAQEGTMTKTLYFKDAAGHMSDGVEVTVKFDLTPPTGKIAVGAKWWQNVLHFISFGNYAAKEYTVTIKAEDKNGSGISKIAYAIVTGSSQYTDADTLKAANLSWTEYNSGSQPTVPVSNSQYVVYARLTDNVGNVTYISTDGILLDNTPPTVGSLSVPEDTKKDVTAGFTFTVSEATDYYYVVLPKDSAAPSAEDIIVTCEGTLPEGTGTAISDTFPKGSGAVSADTLPASVSVETENLSPNTAYTVYVTAVDRAVDISNSASGTPAGNIGNVAQIDFTTKKTLPVITKNPAISGTYGQTIGEMTMTDGEAADNKGTAVTGTWEVSSADRNKKPSAGTAEKVTVIFTPDRDSFDSVSVEITPAVGRRNLNAEGVTVSEVAGTYTYTGSEIKPSVAVDTGTPASGIYISDSGAALTASDFTVSYGNHKDAGTASVTITGKGNYTGSVTRTFAIGKAPGREVPDVSGSYTDNGQTYTYTVTPTEGAVYRMGNDGEWKAENIFEGIKPGTRITFYAMMPEDKNHEEGTAKNITVDFPKLTPAAPALSYKADRTNPADVKVTITPVSGAEYSFDGGKTWTDSNEQGGFTTSQTVVLAIRLKETATHNPSPAQAVTVNLAKKDREAPPAFTFSVEANGETDYTVTIPADEGCEYSFDGKHWSDVNGKTGVNVGETVTGHKRYKETNDYNASSAVSASKTMEKFTVKTPVISPAGGSYSGSVSVTITCASPDAEIYYTTDGSTPGRVSTRYTGAFTVTVPATVKAIAVKEGLTDSAVTSTAYTKKNSGGSGSVGNGGGDSGGNEDNGGQGSGGGDSTNPGNGNTTPQIPVTPPAENINPGNEATPGTGTTPVNPGTGNTVRPGTTPGSGSAGAPAQGTKQPFIKGADGKTGWDVIRAEEENAEEGSIINVDMNGFTVVPGDIFDSIKGKDITITFDMGSGILWSVDGKSITTDKAGDIDFSVEAGVNTVPVDIINNITGESYSIQISLAYEGEFGFTAVLSINIGKENAGYTASLYYYNERTGGLEFICSGEVAEDGTVPLAFTHASDYVIAIDGEQEEDSAAEPAQPEGTDGEAGDGTAENSSVPENPGTGQTGAVWWIIIVILLLTAAIGAGVFVAVKKKGEDENGRQ